MSISVQIAPSLPFGSELAPNTRANGSTERDARGSLASFDASFIGEQAVLTIWGELDICAEPEFRGFLDAVIDCGHGSVMLDLGALDFMDASAIRVIADGRQRLGASGRALTIRSPSSVVLRVLEFTGFGELVPLAHEGLISGERTPGESSIGLVPVGDPWA